MSAPTPALLAEGLSYAESAERLVVSLNTGRFDVVISLPLLEEIADVLTRPRIQIKYKLSNSDIQELLNQ